MGRENLVARLQEILGSDRFIYGSYHSEPALPYGNYAENPVPYYMADDKPYIRIRQYIVRLVTLHKDFNLERRFERAFEDEDVAYQKITDEDIIRQHCYCVEWLVQLLEQDVEECGETNPEPDKSEFRLTDFLQL